MLLKPVVFELYAYKVTEVASQCHSCALLIGVIVGEMFDINMK